jgi:hypothetical protein
MLLTNLSLPYWSMASLETAAFAALILLALVVEHRRPEMTPAVLVIATLLRPEGGLVFLVVLINRMLRERSFPLRYVLIYVVPMLPFLAFKLLYYGSLFPNPYYAKSGVGLEYIASGMEHLWYFTSSHGVFGFLFLPLLLMIKKLWKQYSLLYLFVGLYIAYIVWVGGDVLKVYRFFVPVVPALYVLFVAASRELYGLIMRNRVQAAYLTLLITVGPAIAALLLSKGHIDTYHYNERGIVNKMTFVAENLKQHMGDDFSLAASTIGKVSYELLGHRVIDMLGLTDSYIARNPEQIKGIESTWKERRFNNNYLLAQQPDFILFSTGYKPSAPAERALMLHSEFRRNYRPTGFLMESPGGRQYKVVWMRHDEIDMAADTVHPDIEFVAKLNEGYNHLIGGEYKEAVETLKQSWDHLGQEYTTIIYTIGDCYQRLDMRDSAIVYLNKALAMDPECWEARLRLIGEASSRGDNLTARAHYEAIQRSAPWVLEHLE